MAVRALLVAVLSWLATPVFAAECVRPDLEQLLDKARTEIQADASYFPSAEGKFLPFDSADGRHLQWLGAGWYGPPQGALFVLDCDGNRLAATSLGFVHEIRVGPFVPTIGQTFEVIYTSGYGSGYEQKTVALLAFANDLITTFWNHEVSEEVSAPPLEEEYADTFAWRFAEGRARIEVTGERELGEFKDAEHGWEPNTKHALPAETFCWNAAEKKFQGCK